MLRIFSMWWENSMYGMLTTVFSFSSLLLSEYTLLIFSILILCSSPIVLRLTRSTWSEKLSQYLVVVSCVSMIFLHHFVISSFHSRLYSTCQSDRLNVCGVFSRRYMRSKLSSRMWNVYHSANMIEGIWIIYCHTNSHDYSSRLSILYLSKLSFSIRSISQIIANYFKFLRNLNTDYNPSLVISLNISLCIFSKLCSWFRSFWWLQKEVSLGEVSKWDNSLKVFHLFITWSKSTHKIFINISARCVNSWVMSSMIL